MIERFLQMSSITYSILKAEPASPTQEAMKRLLRSAKNEGLVSSEPPRNSEKS
jgi:hypothetical protein